MPSPIAVEPAKQAKLPLRARLNLWLRRARFRWAWRLVHGMDGVVLSDAALKAATMELAKLPGWTDELFNGQHRKVALLAQRTENVAQLLILASEIGDPELQSRALVDLYTKLRMMTLSRRQREQMGLENALMRLPKRVNPALCRHARRVTPEGQYTKFKCLDCGAIGDVKKEPTAQEKDDELRMTSKIE